MKVYPAWVAILGLSREEREEFALDLPVDQIRHPWCARCQHPMEPAELTARACVVCGAPADFAFFPKDENGKTVADYPDLRAR